MKKYVAFLLALIVNIVVSLATGEPEKEVTDAYDRVMVSMYGKK